MALIVADRVLETSTSTGTAAILFSGAVLGYRTVGSVSSNLDTFYYYIEGVDADGIPTGEWETGLGEYVSGSNSMNRDTIFSSSNSGSIVNFSSGTKRIGISIPAIGFNRIVANSSSFFV